MLVLNQVMDKLHYLKIKSIKIQGRKYMTPEKFISTWTENDLTERSGAQPFIEDLCTLLKLDKPRSSDDFCYEKGAIKDSGKQGWADVWKKDCFGWENKKPKRDLKAALTQLREYSGNLGNPPLLVVCDRERIEIHTVFRGYPDEPHTILLQNIGDLKNQQILKWVFTDPDKLKPLKSNAAITTAAAGKFARLAESMRQRDLDSQQVAHFLTQCIFCMFAEDEGLLHNSSTSDSQIFTSILTAAHSDPAKATKKIKTLFTAMQKKGGEYGSDDIAWFNGGLFKKIDVPPLIESDLNLLLDSAQSLDWRAIDPTIFGTLFERGLDPNCRAQLGAHYTDVATINKLIDPLITQPLTAEWEAAKVLLEKSHGKSTRTKAYKDAVAAYQGFLERLGKFRVLDAACGSGNFLYLALHALKDLEHIAQLDAEILGFGKQLNMSTGTDNILGFEINEYAAELARVTVWIGEIQWCQRNGRPIDRNPILNNLDAIQHRDALLNADGTEAVWPKADVIIGNPPFLGDKVMRGELGDDYVTALRDCYKGSVPGGADFVCYWFDKARNQIEQDKTMAVGLVSTNSIRGGSNRKVLDKIVDKMPIFDAWPDEPWFDAGTAVRVSLVCFGDTHSAVPQLKGNPVTVIHADLTAGDGEESRDITKAKILGENSTTAFIGTQKTGPFDIPGETAREWLKQPNPNNKPNSQVVKPWANGMAVTRRPTDIWVIDFGVAMSEEDASLFELPFLHLEQSNKVSRVGKRESAASRWWLHTRPRPELRKCMAPLKRYIVTPRVSKHRFFVWLPVVVVPDTRLTVITRSEDTTFGILHSRFHQTWSLATCSWHGVGNDPTYNAMSCFETFPFPNGLSPFDTKPKSEEEILELGYKVLVDGLDKAIPAMIAETSIRPHAQDIADAAFKLNILRENWLNPADWVDWVITSEEEKAGFPKRPVAKAGHEADLKKRTLTNLYNNKPSWLIKAHEAIDKAVANAYGWKDYTAEMTDAEILQRLLKLNLDH